MIFFIARCMSQPSCCTGRVECFDSCFTFAVCRFLSWATLPWQWRWELQDFSWCFWVQFNLRTSSRLLRGKLLFHGWALFSSSACRLRTFSVSLWMCVFAPNFKLNLDCNQNRNVGQGIEALCCNSLEGEGLEPQFSIFFPSFFWSFAASPRTCEWELSGGKRTWSAQTWLRQGECGQVPSIWASW